jgi:hypothetical protein
VSGTYLDTIPNASGCDSIISIELTIDCPSSLGNNTRLPLSIYPNPVKDFINIELEELCDDLLVEVYDLTGQIVASKNYKNIKHLTYTFEGPQGIYLVKISDAEGKTSVIKLIKQ